MPADMQLPKTTAELMGDSSQPMAFGPKDKRWYDRELNEKAAKGGTWAAPIDPRFVQQNRSRHCWTYYVDYHRCKTLMGEDYAPCEYFRNVYRDVCPKSWHTQWDDWVEEGKFPARFDR